MIRSSARWKSFHMLFTWHVSVAAILLPSSTITDCEDIMSDRNQVPRLMILRLLFFLLYIVQKMSNNAEGISKMPVASKLKDPTGEGGFAMSSEKIGLFRSDSGLGWYVKALFGPIVDNLPLLGYRRKSWLMLSSALAAASWGWIVLFGESSAPLLFIGLLFVNIFIALGDVICDGMMVEMSQITEGRFGLERGTVNRQLQSAQWVGAMTAMTVGALGGGVIAQFFGLKSAALISGFLPLLLIFFVAFAVKEERVAWDPIKARQGYKAIGILLLVAGIFVAMNRWQPGGAVALFTPLLKTAIIIGAMALVVRIPRQLFVPALFITLWFFVPFNLDGGYCVNYFTQHSTRFIGQLRSTDGAMGAVWQLMVTLKLTTADELATMLKEGAGLADLYYGSVQGSIGAIGGICSAAFFGTRLKQVPLPRLLMVCVAGELVLVGWMAMGISLQQMTPVHLLAFSFVDNFVFLCVLLGALSYGAAVIPGRDQAALYAFLMSLTNVSQQYGIDVIGGAIYDRFGGMQKVTDEAGERVVMAAADNGMFAVLETSAVMLIAIGVVVAALYSRGAFDLKAEDE